MVIRKGRRVDGWRLEDVPGGDGVALGEEDVVSMDWMELKDLGRSAVIT